MGKRPLASGCFMVVLLLYLATLLSPMSYEDYSGYQGNKVTVTGKVYKKEQINQADGQILVLYLRDLSIAEPPGERIVCYLKSGQNEPEIGSLVKLTGRLKAFERASNPGQFDAYSYYHITGISYRLNQAIILEKSIKYDYLQEGLYRFRCFLAQIFKENLSREESALMQTILLGQKGELDKELKSLYQRNGIAHILAISALHVSMLGMGVYKLLRKCGVPMKVAAIFAAFVLVSYGIMTGFSVSAIRAILMFVLHMLAVVVERTYDLLTAVGVAAVMILLEQPFYFYHSGFVFSFGCVLGIGLVMPALTEHGRKKQKKKVLLSAVGMAIITLPLYLWFYYQFPPYSVVLNLLVVPLMSYLMAAGMLLLLFGILCQPLANPFALLISGVFRIYEAACEFCEALPAHMINMGKPEAWQIGVYLAALLCIILFRKKLSLMIRWLIALAACFVLILHPAGELEITFLDVGQGDGIYIESKEGSRFLIDGGSSSVSSVGEYRLMPFLKHHGTQSLDAVFVTHPDEDHCNGIKELLEKGETQGIRVKCLVLPDIGKESKKDAYHELETIAGKAGVPVLYISAGQKIREGELTITCLHPDKGYEAEEANEYSIVLDLSYGDFKALFTGDLEGKGEEDITSILKKQGKRYTVLKVAHHGSAYSTSEEFLDALSPIYTVISCGKNNKSTMGSIQFNDTNSVKMA